MKFTRGIEFAHRLAHVPPIPSPPPAHFRSAPALLASFVGIFLLLVAAPAQADADHPKLFIHCPKTCFEPYLRQELSYFNLVRDRHEAELHVLVARHKTSSGGERFTVTLTHGAAPPRMAELATVPATQPEAARQKLLRVILRLLYEELGATTLKEAFELRLPRRSGVTLSQVADPWDYWAVSPEILASGEAQSSFYTAFVTSSVTLRRMTEKHKLRFKLARDQQLSHFELEDGSTVRGDASAWFGQLVYARSVGRRWAVGLASTERASQRENLKAHLHGGPVVELNLFPYSENASKQLRFAYQVGPWMSWYSEPNVEGETHDVRGYHALSVVVDANQRWGSIQWALQLNSLLNEPARYRLGTSVVGSLQLFEGFAINVLGMGSWVQDQINLRARPLTDNELLLGTVQGKTDFIIQVEMGLSYTFGSVHNAIVNPRFGRLDLEED